MTAALLDINDFNLQLWHGDIRLQSPGYALLDGQQYIFGQAARAAARIRPRDINTRYWWQLNTEALQPALGQARHTADLVRAHLLDMHQQAAQPEELVLAVSSSMQQDQLALLLGIIQSCPFKAVGMVNRSVALASRHGSPGKLYHVEFQLHQVVISELAVNGGEVELRRVFPLPGCGTLQLQEGLVEIIAKTFISQTRFDPRRKAETEQQLYDALPEALRTLQGAGECNMVVQGYSARIKRGDLQVAGEHLFQSTSEVIGNLDPGDRVIMDPVARLMPGLGEQFPQAAFVDNTALPQAVEQNQVRLLQRDQAIVYVTSLPCPIQSTPVPAAPEPVQQAAATHLLMGASAAPLVAGGTPVGAGWELHHRAGAWRLRGDSSAAAQVNGADYHSGQPLHCGDTICIDAGADAATSAMLIEVKA